MTSGAWPRAHRSASQDRHTGAGTGRTQQRLVDRRGFMTVRGRDGRLQSSTRPEVKEHIASMRIIGSDEAAIQRLRHQIVTPDRHFARSMCDHPAAPVNRGANFVKGKDATVFLRQYPQVLRLYRKELADRPSPAPVMPWQTEQRSSNSFLPRTVSWACAAWPINKALAATIERKACPSDIFFLLLELTESMSHRRRPDSRWINIASPVATSSMRRARIVLDELVISLVTASILPRLFARISI